MIFKTLRQTTFTNIAFTASTIRVTAVNGFLFTREATCRSLKKSPWSDHGWAFFCGTVAQACAVGLLRRVKPHLSLKKGYWSVSAMPRPYYQYAYAWEKAYDRRRYLEVQHLERSAKPTPAPAQPIGPFDACK